MKKLLLLCALPLSLAFFSFVTTGTGVTYDKDNYYDIDQNNSISAADQATIAGAIADIYGIQMDPQQTYQLQMINTTSGTGALSTYVTGATLSELCAYGHADIPVLNNRNTQQWQADFQALDATISAYVINN